ncbi:MAG: DNA replication and repair protein RecF [Candidatus Saccharimonadales bacterium]
MSISTIRLQQFRNYQDRTFEFSPGVTVITGNNGIGKTNILEALYIASLGKSFRDPDDLLTMHDQSWWRIEAHVDDTVRDVRYKDASKTITINDKSYKRLSPQVALPVVLFEPDHLMLVHGSPSMRRSYIDKQLAQYTPGYLTILRRYERVVAQRNKLLKHPHVDSDQLFVWDVSLAELATKIIIKRSELVYEWNDSLSGLYTAISDKVDTIRVDYSTSPDNYSQRLLETLRRNLDRDRMIGTTSAGPHRDDMVFYLNDMNMEHNASRGEIRTLVLALKYHNAQQLETLYNTPPLLLLDDVFSELDETRQQKLLASYTRNQIVITTTHITEQLRRDTVSTIAL